MPHNGNGPGFEDYIAVCDKKLFIEEEAFVYCGTTHRGYDHPNFTLVKTDLNGNSINKLSIIEQALNERIFNYPNPFNPFTTIHYNLPYNIQKGLLKIYNVKGEVVNIYKLNNKIGSIVWDGTNSYNDKVSSGIYFYRIEADNYISDTGKMIMVK